MEEKIVISKELYDRALRTSGDRIRTARQSAGFSQLALANLVDASQNHISDLEHNKVTDPGLGTLKKIAEVTGVSIQFLLPELLGEGGVNAPRAVTPEAERVIRIIDALPEEERQTCLNLVKAIQRRFTEGTKKNRKKVDELLARVEQRHGLEARQIIEADLGAFLGVPKLKKNVERQRLVSQPL